MLRYQPTTPPSAVEPASCHLERMLRSTYLKLIPSAVIVIDKEASDSIHCPQPLADLRLVGSNECSIRFTLKRKQDGKIPEF